MSETPQTGYQARTHHKPVKRYCQTLDLRDDPALIAEYRRLHSEQGVWRESSTASVASASSKWKSTCSVRAFS